MIMGIIGLGGIGAVSKRSNVEYYRGFTIIFNRGE
jgi:hypothetical protein